MDSIIFIMPSAFHLGWMGSTRRLMQLAKAFNYMNFNVMLVAGAITNPVIQCEVDQAFPGKVVRMSHTGYYPQLFDKQVILRRAWRVLWKLRGENCYWPNLSWGWAEKMNTEFIRNKILKMGCSPKLVWASDTGYLEGGVAAQRISSLLNLPWIYELQDPPRRAGLGPDNQMVKKCFSKLLNDAVRIVVTAASYGDSLKHGYSVDDEKIRTIHLSYEGKGFARDATAMKRDVLTIAYAGSLNGGRSLKPLLLALATTFKKHPEIRQSIKLELAGGGPGFDEVDQLAAAMGLTENIEAHGVISGDKVAEIIERATIVVVVQEKTSALQVPGKIFETLKAGKAVLGMMPRGCEAANILVRSGLGFIHETNDVDGLSETMIHMWQAWRQSESVAKPNLSFIREFSTEQLPIKLADALKGIVRIPNFPPDAKVEYERETEGAI